MENTEIALKLLLDAIDVGTDIDSVGDRLRIQKAVYLAQAFGVPLGYNYSWYVKGPYSPDLTRDYYNLNASLKAGDRDYEGRTLRAGLNQTILSLKQILARPEDINVNDENWYEALASFHFLVKISKKTTDEAKGFLRTQKPHLTEEIIEAAEVKLRNAGL